MESERTVPTIDAIADDAADSLTAAAAAASIASADAQAAAKSAAETRQAAHEAAESSADLAAGAAAVTATLVAAAATATARTAAETAAAVAKEAADRAANIASSAVAARDAVAAALTDDADRADADLAASALAETVAAAALASATDTEDAAAVVADAVLAAAVAAAVAAHAAAVSVEAAAGVAAGSADVVSRLSAETQLASEAVVGSTARFADLGLLVRAAAVLRRVSAANELPLVAQLRTALDENQFRLHYQPIYRVADGAIVAVEALLRWQHPSRGLLPPVEFIHVAESHPDLVNPVGDWVLAAAAEQAAAWSGEHGTGAPKIWVNVSCDQLGGGRLSQTIEDLIERWGLPPTAVGVEVTERQLIETAGDAAADLAALRGIGVPLALDDFGTGYASFDYLRRFAFDEIKIDRSFVSGLGRDKTDTAVVSSIIELSRVLGLTVVGEGVETLDQYEQLRRLGCETCQGYFLQRPASAQVIGGLLSAA